MSLLDGGANYEPCTVYPEITVTDADGNTVTRASDVGIETEARFQIEGQSGTSARRAEQQDEGYSTEKVYTVRFPRSFSEGFGSGSGEGGIELGAQSKIEWNGQVWSVFGDLIKYNGSRRTKHVVYTIRRS